MAELGALGGGAGSPGTAEFALQMAVTVFRKLKNLDCPFLIGLQVSEPQTIQELLCSPSKYRLDILEWLFVRVCPSLQDKFSCLKGTQTEWKIQEMVKLGQELMLCGPEDQDLVMGCACAQRQLYFMDQMLDAIQGLDLCCSPGSSAEQHFRATREKNQMLLGDLLSDPNLQTLLSPERDLWPMEGQDLLDQQHAFSRRPGLCSEQQEERELAELVLRLQESTARLQALQAQHFPQHKEGAAVAAADPSTLEQRLRLVVSDFHQLMLAFLQVYGDELGECCQRPGAHLHPCGPIIQAVHQALTSCQQMLMAVVEVTDASMRAMGTVAKQHSEALCWDSGSSVMSLAAKMQELSQQYKLFSEAQRKGPA
ncbi:PREDICTED: HAUS augmin-like complex subunit 7 [Elephantulus edwardii]|uniref:HAUS augmin-like complex subunit 7 n=1 Tax=Elephantulus edwardii TaxID=28737 RepID=UPI0003F0B50A|nr:PREDICTED: HAUS augmin-like complex subunit 7 [Elephantulus edwardii]